MSGVRKRIIPRAVTQFSLAHIEPFNAIKKFRWVATWQCSHFTPSRNNDSQNRTISDRGRARTHTNRCPMSFVWCVCVRNNQKLRFDYQWESAPMMNVLSPLGARRIKTDLRPSDAFIVRKTDSKPNMCVTNPIVCSSLCNAPVW